MDGNTDHSAYAIELTDVTKSFGREPNVEYALRGVSVRAQRGEVRLLMGPSGSGKTTLLSIMGCILRPTTGSVRVAGGEVTGLGQRPLAGVRLRHIGFIFQEYNLFPTLTVLQNVLVALDLQGVTGRRAHDMAMAALEAVGLADKHRIHPGVMSGGQKQRLAIARALAGEPEILLADEPTAALDSENGRAVMDLLRRLAHEKNRAVVIVTHDRRTLEFADRVSRIEDGLITEEDLAAVCD